MFLEQAHHVGLCGAYPQMYPARAPATIFDVGYGTGNPSGSGPHTQRLKGPAGRRRQIDREALPEAKAVEKAAASTPPRESCLMIYGPFFNRRPRPILAGSACRHAARVDVGGPFAVPQRAESVWMQTPSRHGRCSEGGSLAHSRSHLPAPQRALGSALSWTGNDFDAEVIIISILSEARTLEFGTMISSLPASLSSSSSPS